MHLIFFLLSAYVERFEPLTSVHISSETDVKLRSWWIEQLSLELDRDRSLSLFEGHIVLRVSLLFTWRSVGCNFITLSAILNSRLSSNSLRRTESTASGRNAGTYSSAHIEQILPHTAAWSGKRGHIV